MTEAAIYIFLFHFCTTAFMTGLIWFVQVVHYPLFAFVGREDFTNYEKLHCIKTTFVVGPVMVVELLTAFALLFVSIPTPKFVLAFNFLALLGIWLSTFVLQTPAHSKLSDAFSLEVQRKLVQGNWLRTFLWSLRLSLLFWIIVSLIQA